MTDFLDLTFDDDGGLTIWIPVAEDEWREFNVKGRVDPYQILELSKVIGKGMTLRILDEDCQPVAPR